VAGGARQPGNGGQVDSHLIALLALAFLYMVLDRDDFATVAMASMIGLVLSSWRDESIPVAERGWREAVTGVCNPGCKATPEEEGSDG
jgi:hypothetical protein